MWGNRGGKVKMKKVKRKKGEVLGGTVSAGNPETVIKL